MTELECEHIEMERRCLSNMIEVMIRQYCDKSGIRIPDVAVDQHK